MLNEKSEKGKEILNRAKKPHARTNSPETIQKCRDAWNDYRLNNALYHADFIPDLHIAAGNRKTGVLVNSVSLPPVVTCGGNCKTCKKYCYAVPQFIQYPAVRRTYCDNLYLFLKRPATFAARIASACYNIRFFRWHVAGDIVNTEYLKVMVDVATRCPWCEFLAFTKQYRIVNGYISNRENQMPENLHLIFSAAPGVAMPNPYGVPECHIDFENPENNTFKGCAGSVYHCSGNCSDCIGAGCGCFYLRRGDAVIINQH